MRGAPAEAFVVAGVVERYGEVDAQCGDAHVEAQAGTDAVETASGTSDGDETSTEANAAFTLAAENAAAQGLPTPPNVDISSWELLLANSRHPIGDYTPPQLAYLNMTGDETDIQYSYNEYRCPVDSRIAEALVAFSQACKAEGLPVYLSSGYRSYDDQNYLFQRKIGQGYTEDVAATIVARPGTSEHQTGLACDITDYYHELKDSTLENTATYQWMKEHCAEYGFVVRYPADKSGSADSITGIIYEPWHFRYVGVEPAVYMTENGLCLEEFLMLYEGNTVYLPEAGQGLRVNERD